MQHLPTERKEQNLQKLEELILLHWKRCHTYCTSLKCNGNGSKRWRRPSPLCTRNTWFLEGFLVKYFSVYTVGGSIIEKDSLGQLYNTCLVIDPQGKFIHRKIHLFKIDRPGRLYDHQEHQTLEFELAVDLEIFTKPMCNLCVWLCYGIRFQELAQIYCQKGCKLLLYPGAFNTVTDPAHLAAM